MQSLARRALASVALLALLALTLSPFATAGDYDKCGTLVPGVECAMLFQDDDGDTWLLEDFGGFQLGDVVRVTGTADTGCISICFSGCIENNTIGPCGDPTSAYCTCTGGPCGNPDPAAGCANSTGSGALLTGQGSVSVSADNLHLTAEQLPPHQSAIFYMGGASANVLFGDGLRCVGDGASGIFRFPVQNGGAAGVITLGPVVGFTHANFPPGGQIQPGQTWFFQCWYRDPSGPCGSTFNLSNGVSASFGI